MTPEEKLPQVEDTPFDPVNVLTYRRALLVSTLVGKAGCTGPQAEAMVDAVLQAQRDSIAEAVVRTVRGEASGVSW